MSALSMLFLLTCCFMVGCASESESDKGNSTDSTATTAPKDTPKTDETPKAKVEGVINPNLATQEEMMALPHMTEGLAADIIENRPYMGMPELHPFLSASLSADQLKELYVNFYLPINLNTASREIIMTVPGIGEKMAHEFEEYRPYKAPAQFDREMGKYVDEAEVKRFRQYIFVPVNLNEASDEHIMTIPGMGDRMLHEFKEYRPYKAMAQFDREIAKYVD
ncbi:MAG: helix-hairpin-helix domain-containing protein, partial [Bacteroidota bacterium]